MKQKFLYTSLFMYGSLQSVGHTVDYFVPRTEKLVVFYIMPRVNNVLNLLRIYRDGKLVLERQVPSSKNILLYYLLWLYYHNVFLLRYFSRHEKFVMLGGHPVAFMGMRVMKIFRRVVYAYWIGDYFPPVHWSLIAFEKLKRYYHDRMSYTFYLSDTINKIFNGRVVQKAEKRTVMWGVKPPKAAKVSGGKSFNLLFVGIVRPSQGIEDALDFLSSSPDARLTILGSCEKQLYERLMKKVRELGLSKRVRFPNRFVDDTELVAVAKKHDVGIALYETGVHTATHYTDPGKVKTYIELGLPLVMTNTSAVVPYIKKYSAGVVINTPADISVALNNIYEHREEYQNGIRAFAHAFDYQKYYKKAFVSLEHL